MNASSSMAPAGAGCSVATGGWLTSAMAMTSGTVADAPARSVAFTVSVSVPSSPLFGVPDSRPVAGSKASHAGSCPPPLGATDSVS